ncbi:pilus assembly protein PilW [Vibrio sp. V27_P1S3P104]|uniref:pilus assembly protein PilW n=1 Tax=unclassified Vibrio TaxID=2614977 RepID=UPI001372E527|nr:MULTISPECIES: pilus assembly protein PilW [unclassified Vibrio]NAW68411.1 pilus assembly protein PilW [Vibrio sp. V28_P6S34P95]NAX05517.1 pilus assembly protein PilW [Vibrio sp. V30_P3S12P165]NAX33585.1 pilus assembly protein PilW [Vibrio sp. V29_P1S30P107]NAX38222.1 pilus assembly protein PilW [Vibrio sp. V27_P1S3P104]NAX40633.1 pilus assembly protein PilW [Vibrio sp. V26_P1S5P106]
MALLSVKPKQSGSSLIEFMIAGLVGAIALGMIGSLFLSNQRASLQRSKEIMLLQQMSVVLHQMKSDVLRAGYDHWDTHSLKLSGAVGLFITEPELVGYAYQHPAAVSASVSNTVYRLDKNNLKYCQKSSTAPLPATSAATGCFNLFDPKQIKVTQFSVQHDLVAGESTQSGMLSIVLAASLVKAPSVSQQMSLRLMQRNWQ